MELVRMNVYRRNADVLKNSYDDIRERISAVEDKIVRDDFTGCYNKKFIYDMLNELCTKTTAPFAVVYLDINGLKYVNDNFGHDKGDEYILAIVGAVRHAIREDDFPARIGGDEFLIILPDVNEDSMNNIVNRIQQNIARASQNAQIRMAASIGGVIVTQYMKNNGIKFILDRADELMRENKAKFYDQIKGGR